jgi:hypothetical protein
MAKRFTNFEVDVRMGESKAKFFEKFGQMILTSRGINEALTVT